MKKIIISSLLLVSSLCSWGSVCKGKQYTIEMNINETNKDQMTAEIRKTKSGVIFQELSLIGYDQVLHIPDSRAMGFYRFQIIDQRTDLTPVTNLTWEFGLNGKRKEKLVNKVTFTIDNSEDISVDCN